MQSSHKNMCGKTRNGGWGGGRREIVQERGFDCVRNAFFLKRSVVYPDVYGNILWGFFFFFFSYLKYFSLI